MSLRAQRSNLHATEEHIIYGLPRPHYVRPRNDMESVYDVMVADAVR